MKMWTCFIKVNYCISNFNLEKIEQKIRQVIEHYL